MVISNLESIAKCSTFCRAASAAEAILSATSGFVGPAWNALTVMLVTSPLSIRSKGWQAAAWSQALYPQHCMASALRVEASPLQLRTMHQLIHWHHTSHGLAQNLRSDKSCGQLGMMRSAGSVM